MRTDLVLDALRMALARRRRGADVELVHHSDAGRNTRRSRSPRSSTTRVLGVDRVGRRRLRQRPGRELRRLFKTELIADRVWPSPRTARAGDRRMRRLVQPRPPARNARRHPARRVRNSARPPTAGFPATDRSRHSRRGPQIAITGIDVSANASTTRQTAVSALTDRRPASPATHSLDRRKPT
jgi:hypothetical protein